MMSDIDLLSENFTVYICVLIIYVQLPGGASGVMVIVEGNGHGDTSSNPGQD